MGKEIDLFGIREYHVARISSSCHFLTTEYEKQLLRKALREALEWGMSGVAEQSFGLESVELPPYAIVKGTEKDFSEEVYEKEGNSRRGYAYFAQTRRR